MVHGNQPGTYGHAAAGKRGDDDDVCFARPDTVFQTLNFRSDRQSVLNHPFANKWLNLAIGWELLMLVLIVRAFTGRKSNVGLPLSDWLIMVSLAFTVWPGWKLAKWMERRGWFGKLQ